MWEAFYIVGFLILVAGFAYGIRQSRVKSGRNAAVTEAATRQSYAHPDRYSEAKRDDLKSKLQPEDGTDRP